MLVPISEIKINAGRREADPEGVQELVDSISKVGLLNPITIDREHTLIAGLHRLEAAKLLGWTEIE
ncbi:MAG: ParB N-terminal domain-containing protein, partial [Oscillospiraceae bacterium]